MSDIVIRVENLGKKYVIGHRSSESYAALRDVLANGARNFGRKILGRDDGAESATEEFWALKDVSLEISQGDRVGIIGRNGAGKSTLLKILSRITEPSLGRIRLKGRVASLLEVGTGFHPELTGRENIFLNGSIIGMSRQEIKAKFDEIVAFAEIDKFLDTPVKRYSSGMYVRLAFAVSAHLQTDILVVDEVLAVGDAEFQKKCMGKMEEVSTGQGRTVLFVSHQLGAIRRLCTSACLLSGGMTDGIVPVETALHAYTASMRESPFDLDVSGVRRSNDFGEIARITRITVPPDEPLRYGDPLKIVFQVESSSLLKDVIIGFAFDSLDGYRVMTVDSDNSGPKLSLEAGVHEVCLEIDRNPLHPTTYSCGAAVFSRGQVIDTLPNCATWEVMPSKIDLANAAGFSGSRLPVKVSVSNVNALT
jgi:lipopolysaccharide transport system ATP-binding protein